MKYFFLLISIALASFFAVAQKAGDNRFIKMKFESAANAYSRLLNDKSVDSIYLFEQLGHCYRAMNDPAVAEFWYKKAVEGGSRKPEVLFQLAQMQRMNMRYEEARKILLRYRAARPMDYSVDDILTGLENIRELQKDRGIYKVEPSSFNTSRNDMTASFLADSTLLFVSNRKGKAAKSLSDDWKGRSFNRLYFLKENQKVNRLNVASLTGVRLTIRFPTTLQQGSWFLRLQNGLRKMVGEK